MTLMDDRALDDCLRRLRDDSTNVALLDELVLLAKDLDRTDDAIQPLWHGANALVRQKAGRDALKLLKHLVTLAPDDSRNLAWLASECAKTAFAPELAPLVQRALSQTEHKSGHIKGVEWLLAFAALPTSSDARPDALAKVFLDKPDTKSLQEAATLFEAGGFTAHAARFLADAAERFTEDGFFMKAVNLLKHATKLEPDRIDLEVRLGDLHEALGLFPEAQTYFRGAALRYEKLGDRQHLDEVKKRLVSLEKN